MKNKFSALLIGTSIALGGFGLAMTATSAQAASLTTYSLNTNNNPDAPTDWYDVGFTVNGDGTVTFRIDNNTATNPTNSTIISQIYFGTDGGTATDETDGFFKYFQKNIGTATGTTPGTNYRINWNPTSGSQILQNAGWGVEILADNVNGADRSVINAGEFLAVTFTLQDAYKNIDEAGLIDAFFDPQELGVAFHVQRIGTAGYSEWYQALPDRPTTSVPEPASLVGLGVVAAGMVAARRRRGYANS